MNNRILSDLLFLKAQGMPPMAAAQQLSQRYPQFRQAFPYLNGKSLQEIDSTGQNFARSMGLDPMQMVAQFMGRK